MFRFRRIFWKGMLCVVNKVDICTVAKYGKVVTMDGKVVDKCVVVENKGKTLKSFKAIYWKIG